MGKVPARAKAYWHIGLVLLSLLTSLSFVLPQLSKHFVTDEEYFARAARAIAETANPRFYQWHYSWEPSVAVYRWGLEQTPLYVYLLALVFKVGGTTPITARLLGYSLFLVTIVLVYLLGRSLALSNHWPTTIPVYAVCLLLLNPMMLQGALLIDIDNSLLTVLLTLFLLCLRWSHSKSIPFQVILLGFIWGVSLSTKLTTPLFLPPLVLLFYALQGDRRRAVVVPILTTLIGLALFFSFWSLYSWKVGVPFSLPFEHAFGQYFRVAIGIEYGVGLGYLVARVKDLGGIVFWLSPALAVLFGVSLLDWLSCIWTSKRNSWFDLLYLYSLTILITYVFVKGMLWDFPKYHIPALPILAIMAAVLIDRLIHDLADLTMPKNWFIYGIISVGLFLYFLLFARDPLVILFDKFSGRKLLTEAQAILIMIFPLVAVVAFLRAYHSQWPLRRVVLLSALITLVPSNLSLDFWQSQARYSTTYHYGEKGMTEVIERIRHQPVSGQIIFARRDIAYAVGRTFIQAESFFPDIARFRQVSDIVQPQFIVISHRHIGISDPVSFHNRLIEVLGRKYRSQHIGDFSLFERAY